MTSAPFSPAPAEPPSETPDPALGATLDALAAVLGGRRIAVLAGAGLSTDSGIPDYRGPETRHRARNPIQYNAFVAGGDEGAAARQRYWARAALGWSRIGRARPNGGHRALAALEAAGLVSGVVTQNVDGLHHAAGSARVVELHGSLGRVLCLACRAAYPRADVQRWAEVANPGHLVRAAETAPDGDVELDGDAVAAFVVPTCPACGGALKPDVVFFGESVPAATVAAAWSVYEDADALLVVGSSLAVYSGLRFVHRAARECRPVALVTLGETRADALVTVKADAPLGVVLPALARRLVAA